MRWIGSFVLVATLALLGFTAWVLGTEAGANWVAGEAELLTDGAVRMTGVQGTLAEGLEIDAIAITAGTTRMDGRGLTLRMLPASMLRGRLSVVTLHAQQLVLSIKAAEPPTGEPFRMPTVSVPFSIDVEELGIGELVIRRGESASTVTGIGLAGSMQGTQIRLRGLQGALAGLELHVEGTARLEPELPVDARVEWRLADPVVSGAGTVRGNLAALDVEQLLQLPGGVVAVSARLRDLVSVQAEASWDLLELPVPGLGGVRTSAGRATLAGTPDAWQATLASDARAPELPAMRASATAHGDVSRVVFDVLRLDGALGALVARGELGLVPPRRLGLDITASNVDTSALRPGLRGRFSARARLDAELPGEARIRIADLRGSLMGRPLAGSGDIGYRDGLLTFGNVVVRAGPNHLRADGSLGDRLAGRFDLDAPELGVLWPDLAGSLIAHATLAGTRAQPVIDLDASGRQLTLAGNAAQTLELHGHVDRTQRVAATLSARGLEAGGNALGNLDAGLQGTLDAHRLTAHLAGGLFEAQVESAGSWNGKTLQHRIGSASISTDQLGPWRLSGEPEVAVAAAAATVGDHCWEQPPASLCLSALSWSPARSHGVAVLQGLDMRYFDRWLPEDVTVTGRAYAALSLDVTAAGPDGSAIWRQEETTVYYNLGDEPLATPLETAQLAAQITPEQVLATLELHAPGGVQLSGTGSMRWPPGPEAPLEGKIAGRVPDIAPLLPWIAGNFDLAEVAGSVTLDAGIAGTLAAPRVSGEARLAGGSLALADLGVTLRDIDVALLGDGSDALKLQGSAKAGGLLTLDGELRPIEKDGPTAWVRIRGNKVDAVRLPDRYVQASPDLTLRYAAGEFSIEGGVTIPKAEIVVRALPESAVSPSTDTVVHDRGAAEADAGPRRIIGGEFAVNLGPAVHLKAFGLDTLLEGTVKLSQGPDGEPRGYGVVRLQEGKFGAYGKELTIERGTLGFAGPLDDPSIELRASRQVEWEGRTVTAGVMVSGTVTRPESRVFSNPAMSEVDALSYLISGRPMQSTTSTDRSSIGSAALALGVQQASPLTQSLGSAVTLDELGMQGSTLEETEMVAGKQLGSDLYVRFTYGLFNRIGTVLARYKIHRNLSIEAASGEDQSLDLIYSVEKD